MDTYSVILLIYTDYVYKDISEDVDKWFGTPNYNEKRGKDHCLQDKNKEVIVLMKDKGGKIFTKFAATKPKIYSYCMEKDHHEK